MSNQTTRSLYIRLHHINQTRNIIVFLLLGILLVTQDKFITVLASLVFVTGYSGLWAIEKTVRKQLPEPMFNDGQLTETTESARLSKEEARRLYEWLTADDDGAYRPTSR